MINCPLLLHKNTPSSARTKTFSFRCMQCIIQDGCAGRFGQFYGLLWSWPYLSLTFGSVTWAGICKMQTLKFPWWQPVKPIRERAVWYLCLELSQNCCSLDRSQQCTLRMECICGWIRACTWISLDVVMLTCCLSFAVVCILPLNENVTGMYFVSWIFSDMWTHAILAGPCEMY